MPVFNRVEMNVIDMEDKIIFITNLVFPESPLPDGRFAMLENPRGHKTVPTLHGYMASPGCQVDCIDLSPDYYVAALLLNRLTRLGEQVAVHVGSTLEIPFADNLFDAVWMQNVGMNISDKPKLYQEINRVLKPGGRFVFQEMATGETPTTYLPLPWATDAPDHFLISLNEQLFICQFINGL